MHHVAADWGGSIGRNGAATRNWMGGSRPGIAVRAAPVESSPIGDGERHWGEAMPIARRSVRRRFAFLACIALLGAAGIASVGHGAYILAKAELAQWLLHSAWSRTRVTGLPVKPWPWADTHPVVRLIAADQDTDLLVLAGASGRTLAFGPGHLDGSALPGEPGNAILTAHRDTHFRFLQHVAVGDPIAIESPRGGRRNFRVREVRIVDQSELAFARDTRVPTLTLVTCYPFDAIKPGGPLRYVVIAEAA
ncbi:MAG: class GN sortase [Casimicrobiaceae bacterium]